MRAWTHWLAFLVVFLPALMARADDRAAAQQLFAEAKKLMKAGQFEAACPKLEAAAELSQTPGVRLNLGDCYEKLARTASAWAEYAEALAIAERTTDKVAIAAAKKAREALGPKLTYLTVNVGKKVRAMDGVSVSCDGKVIPEAAWSTALPIDPGTHEVTASAPSYQSFSERKEVQGVGTRSSVDIQNLVKLASPEKDSSAKSTGTRTERVTKASAKSNHTLAYVTGGLGLVALAAGVKLGLDARSLKDDYESHRRADGSCADPDCATSSHGAASAGNKATLAFAAGGALLATSAVLYFALSPEPTRARVGATATPIGARVVMGGAF